jgi:hypothetical protein
MEEMRNAHEISDENLKRTCHFGDLEVDGRIMLTWVLNKRRNSERCSWHRMESSVELW